MSQVHVPECFYRLSVKALILDGVRFLVIQDETGRWDFPGGGLKFREKHDDCLRRELKEEMGLDVLHVAAYPSYFLTDQLQSEAVRGTWYANVFYQVVVGSLNFTPSRECVAFRFVSPQETKDLGAYNNVEGFARMFEPGRLF